MKRIILYSLCCSFITINTAQSQLIDILSEDDTVQVSSEASTPNIVEKNSEKQEANVDDLDENSTLAESDKKASSNDGIFSFITKPISLLFSAGDTVTSEDGKKETFLERSIRQANEGKLEDQMNLGYMYLYGTNGVNQNFEEAFKYYTMAAKQNDPIALNNLGSLYFNGIGTPKNIPAALAMFDKSADLGNDNAAINLAFIYLTGGAQDPIRNKKAIELFQQAEKLNNKIARFMLGYAYYTGFVVEQDLQTAFKLIKSSVAEENSLDEAQIVLGDMYIKGEGTVQDYSSGMKYYRAAASQGNIDAYMYLGKIYKEGKIYSTNPILAHAYFNLAAVQNEPGAAEMRDEIGKKIKLEMLLQAQSEAQKFSTTPSELTNFVRKTFGYNIRRYIDMNNITATQEQEK